MNEMLDMNGSPLTSDVFVGWERWASAPPRAFVAYVHPRAAYQLNDPAVRESWTWRLPAERLMKSRKWYRRRNKERLQLLAKQDEIARDAGRRYDEGRKINQPPAGVLDAIVKVERGLFGRGEADEQGQA